MVEKVTENKIPKINSIGPFQAAIRVMLSVFLSLLVMARANIDFKVRH